MTIRPRQRNALVVAAGLAMIGVAVGLVLFTRVQTARQAEQEHTREIRMDQAIQTLKRQLSGSSDALARCQMEVRERRKLGPRYRVGDFYTPKEKQRFFKRESGTPHRCGAGGSRSAEGSE